MNVGDESRALLAALPTAAGIVRIDGEHGLRARWCCTNESLAQLLRRDAAQLADSDVHAAWSDADRTGVEADFAALLAGSTTRTERRVRLDADETARLTMTRLGNGPLLLAQLDHDHELQRRLLQLRVTERALHAAASGIVICDARAPDTPMTYVNAAFERMTGYTKAEVLGRNCRFLNRDDRDQPGLREVREALTDYRETTVVLRNFRKDGTAFWNELTLSPVADREGQVTHFIGIQDDITDRMEFAAERERLLADSMAQRETAARAARARDTLLAVVSHELRSPLNGIRLWTSLLQDSPSLDPDLVSRAATQIEQGVATQSRIIEDLLDVSRFESGHLELRQQRHDLVEIVQDIVRRNQPIADDNELALTFESKLERATALVDAQRIAQVLQNLLDNATKFSAPGGRITVALRGTDEHVEVAVRDEGRGIEPSQLSSVFDQYWQASGRDARTHGGLGLGLNLVKQIVEHHDGTVAAHSDGPGTGATLTFRLPRHRSEARPRGAARVGQDDPEPVAGDVLVVDDDSGTVEAIALGLRMRGFEVRIAGDVDAAITAIDERRPAILVSDLMMGDRSGFELARHLRQHEFDNKLPRTPAIAISGRGNPGDTRAARLAGFDRYLTKPVGMRLLESELHALRTMPKAQAPASVVVADPDRERAEALRQALLEHGHAVQLAATAADALALIDAQPVDVVIAADELGDGTGRDLLDSVRREDDETLTMLAAATQEADDAHDHVAVAFDAPQTLALILLRWQTPSRTAN